MIGTYILLLKIKVSKKCDYVLQLLYELYMFHSDSRAPVY